MKTLKLHIIKTKAGFAIQNTQTYTIISIHKTEEEAEQIVKKLTQ